MNALQKTDISCSIWIWESPNVAADKFKNDREEKAMHNSSKNVSHDLEDRGIFQFKKQQFELENLRVMSLKSIRNLNLFATLTTGYIGIMSPEKDDTVFMMELRECSKRIYDISKFIFYALGYTIERALARTCSGIKSFLMKKVRSQQLTLAQCFGMELSG